MQIENEAYSSAGVDLNDLTIWDKKLENWSQAILGMEKLHEVARKKIALEYEVDSIERRACEIVIQLSEPLAKIFAAQMRDPKMKPGSWYDKDHVATNALLLTIEDMQNSGRYVEYKKHLGLIAKLAVAKKSKKFESIAKKLQSAAFKDYDAGRPMLYVSVHSYNRDQLTGLEGTKLRQVEPDMRLYFKTEDEQVLTLARQQNKILNKLSPAGKKQKLHPMIVDFVMGSGWQVASVTTGELMDENRYMVAQNLFKYQPDVERVCTMSGLPDDREQLKRLTALIYTAHEGGHNYFKGLKLKGIYAEIDTDLRDVQCNFRLSGLDKRYLVSAMLGNYLREVRGEKGEIADNNWGYAMSSNFIVAQMIEQGLILVDGQKIEIQMAHLDKFLKHVEETHKGLLSKDKKTLKRLKKATVSMQVVELQRMVCGSGV